MLFSCLVDADFLATEKYLDPDRSEHRVDGATCNLLRERLDRYLAEKVNDATHVNRRRAEVLDACRAKASQPPGFFSLNVPTGGGKTLSSLAFALRHAEEHGLRRVVYAIPFTSIIEQTADVFREALSDEVLEHHSSLEPDDPARQTDRSRLAAENFDASLIVTTNVQLFESLFASRNSRCRKLHRLAKSVIIVLPLGRAARFLTDHGSVVSSVHGSMAPTVGAKVIEAFARVNSDEFLHRAA